MTRFSSVVHSTPNSRQYVNLNIFSSTPHVSCYCWTENGRCLGANSGITFIPNLVKKWFIYFEVRNGLRYIDGALIAWSCILFSGLESGLKDQMDGFVWQIACGTARDLRSAWRSGIESIKMRPRYWCPPRRAGSWYRAQSAGEIPTTPLPLLVANYRLQGRDVSSVSAAVQSAES